MKWPQWKLLKIPNWKIENLQCQWKDICGQEGDKQQEKGTA